MSTRDPLSERYDAAVRRMLLEAMQVHADNPARPRAAEGWISSPPAEFARPDRGGRTKHERAFTRALYYQVFTEPVGRGADPDWSARLTWGAIGRRGQRWGRTVRVRLFVYGVRSQVAATRRGSWMNDQGGGSYADGTRRSSAGDRIDGRQ